MDLEITQRGKSCHAHCRIYHQVGECIVRLDSGIFARVIHGGVIHCDDEVTYTPPTDSRIRVAVSSLYPIKAVRDKERMKVALVFRNIWKKEAIMSHH